VRLPRCSWAYRPYADVPAAERRSASRIVFGSFNNLLKINPEVLTLWAHIVRRVPGSQLFLKAASLGWAEAKARVLHRLQEAGVSETQIRLEPPTGQVTAHLACYSQVDIGLDPFPYNGTTTTCEALWMGVPVITLAGSRHSARVGASLLPAAGLGELVAGSPDEYVDKALALAADEDRRMFLRRTLRQQILGNPLGQPASLARALERTYRELWHRWLDGR
jgi:protein O-GlcNAc transferase